MHPTTFNPQAIRRIREQRGFTMDAVVEHIGITKQTLYNWESGDHIPGADDIAKLAALFNVPVSDFYDGK